MLLSELFANAQTGEEPRAALRPSPQPQDTSSASRQGEVEEQEEMKELDFLSPPVSSAEFMLAVRAFKVKFPVLWRPQAMPFFLATHPSAPRKEAVAFQASR